MLGCLTSLAALYACSSSSDSSGDGANDAATNDDASTSDASTNDSASDAANDSGALTPCPTSDAGGIDVPGSCFIVTPAETGADSTGENATVPSYALTPQPAATPRNQLVLFLNASGGAPSHSIADPQTNFFGAATSLGYSVLAISYSSDKVLGIVCDNDDACFFASRKSIILGVAQPGAAADFASIRLDEGVVDRVVLALNYLAANDPSGGWDSYLVAGTASQPETEIAWNKIVTAGHSQGGGHAAAIGRLFPVNRVVQLSSTCDDVDGGAISWTDGTASGWGLDPSQFYGLGSAAVFGSGGTVIAGDKTCPYHATNWNHLGMAADHRADDAGVCGHVGDQHSESIQCVENAPLWLAMLR